jgi:hypothetical protein
MAAIFWGRVSGREHVMACIQREIFLLFVFLGGKAVLKLYFFQRFMRFPLDIFCGFIFTSLQKNLLYLPNFKTCDFFPDYFTSILTV